MAHLALECPHCRAEKIGFGAKGCVQIRANKPETLLFLQCEGCGHGLVAEFASFVGTVQQWMNNQVESPGGLVAIYPVTTALKSPADVPGPVQSAYLSGLDNLGRKGGANAAAIMFRRAIEIAAKTINPNAAKGDNLKKRIDDLPPDVATPAMKAWAQHIRLDANDAAHDTDEFSDDDAKKLHTFAEMFLTYAFTLPAMLKKAAGTNGKSA